MATRCDRPYCLRPRRTRADRDPERAAALAERGDHAAAANEYESLAASTLGGDANTWRLSAIEQWLLADRVEPAANGLALLAAHSMSARRSSAID